MDDLLADFVAETREMLEASSGEIVAWEADPSDRARLDTIFRFVHTVKGNCGFFDLPRLAALSHAAEDALADCRSGRRKPDGALVTAVLAIIDRIAAMIDAIEAGEDFAGGSDDELIAGLGLDGKEARNAASSQHETGAPAKPEKPETSTAPLRERAVTQRSIRLPVELLDRVMSGVSDMVLARNDLANRLRQAGTQPMVDGPFERLTSILNDVRDAITRMRMQRIDTLFSAFPRLVRDLSQTLGKEVAIELKGGDVELDREMIEMIRDPLNHILRNCVDHGIEAPDDRRSAGKDITGFISVIARQSGNMISIVVSDDGRGLCEESIAQKAIAMELMTLAERKSMRKEDILQMIFRPGFSTAKQVSSISGRGVGLDVVRQNLERVGGTIHVTSTKGAGTLFTLKIPLTLSIITGLNVEVSGQRFSIPQSYVEEVIHSSSKAFDFERVGETGLVTFRGNRVPCLKLGNVLDLPPSELADEDQTMVMLRLANGELFALAVDEIHSHGDIVVKPLAPAVMQAGIYAGSSLLDDGMPVLLLDITNIAIENDILSDLRSQPSRPDKRVEDDAEKTYGRVMLFNDFDGRRRAIRLELVKRIETVPLHAIDRSGPTPRVVIDGVILPIVGLPEGSIERDKLRCLRLSDGNSQLAYAVSQVLETAELSNPLQTVNDDPLVEAVTLLGENTVSLSDSHELFARFGERPMEGDKPVCRLPEGEWSHAILAPLLTNAGYNVTYALNAGEDIAIWFDDEFEAAAALDMEFASPVVRLRETPEAPEGSPTIYRYDREGLLDALNKARRAGGALR
ncbi:chemotaxis protein CheA [Erythrobacter sp. SCSIO 43205]|uniref:chemotaxis protein CheA n=1 Tax=Erythrobacter sp. SCSIO 43205 TaxID=2779361 RepID=UPI001CA80AB3|nr:chemotaxis protein CheA [Erythrobacter sp. SCSIO 43205]UAB77964.1 chemotaxis protein CheA [Erythrobacter sp. SCSIO 43205]